MGRKKWKKARGKRHPLTIGPPDQASLPRPSRSILQGGEPLFPSIWPGSQIVFREHVDGMEISVPPAGLSNLWGEAVIVSLMWLVVLTGASLSELWGFIREPSFLKLLGALFLGLLGCGVGLSVLFQRIHMCIRRTVLTVTDDGLAIVETGLVRAKRGQWHRNSIMTIHREPISILRAKGVFSWPRRVRPTVPCQHLRVEPKAGRPWCFLHGRHPVELDWIAEKLSGALLMLPRPGPCEGGGNGQ